MDTTRVRKAFKYPSDDDGTDVSHDELDEQDTLFITTEQENLLTKLRASESSTNAQYTLIFTVLPLIVSLPFFWYLSISTTRTMALLCLLSITSLGASAYIMHFVPIPGSSSSSSRSGRRPPPSSVFGTGTRSGQRLMVLDETPINHYLPYLSGSISALLLLAAWGYQSRTDVPEGLWLFLLLPAVIFGMVFMARRSIIEIQTGLTELQGMRYEYKGA
ncbi:hypothetical protein LTR99_002915 [Exophiala xenobiotica]|uniref:Uncharacterized protein n=1 Tax=Vermiconidia calcicola TaxID=1690605 RepID=A0AAV9QDB3_9PEZI|nr:hypothetical protein H2202_006514 [Exophiala xenobiotica]KAK5538585.1 hypothetical protein LTR25_004127 [Vermiconidia calcicola]KAK5194414.1 hypothetical protein LTR92_005656 [Exophiala xenobiotica]KAK5267983.1 hypothetical protein LTR96_006528 [Exophiala xenobiotica]KAK5305373.1 hypothetical protein LTR99_002915 [Exophiala xenobiotica]